ncbi:MAG: DoxX family protein, partial [Acidobacteria bacterium]|nr:DoxX family protein [Acidobacteriota bacterium]
MAALIVLLASWFVLRGAGELGIRPLRTWQHSAVYALAVMFVFTASAHFNKMKHDLVRMIPSAFPQPLLLVYITGVLEFLGAFGLVFYPFRRLAGICLAIMLVGLFTANVKAALQGVTLRGRPATRLW